MQFYLFTHKFLKQLYCLLSGNHLSESFIKTLYVISSKKDIVHHTTSTRASVTVEIINPCKSSKNDRIKSHQHHRLSSHIHMCGLVGIPSTQNSMTGKIASQLHLKTKYVPLYKSQASMKRNKCKTTRMYLINKSGKDEVSM